MILGSESKESLDRILVRIGKLETLIEGHDQINEERTKEVKEVLFNIGLDCVDLIKNVYIDPRMEVNKLLRVLRIEDIGN